MDKVMEAIAIMKRLQDGGRYRNLPTTDRA
jgi:hypothetical protein